MTRFYLNETRDQVRIHAVLERRGPNQYVILPDVSFAYRQLADSVNDDLHNHIPRRRNQAVRDGILEEYDAYLYRVAREKLFPSPSPAAEFLLGRAINGRTAWKDACGNTIAEIERRERGHPFF